MLFLGKQRAPGQTRLNDLPPSREAETIIVRSMEVRHEAGWCSTLTNVSKSPLNNLALYWERGLDFLCFWGLGGTFGGLREWNIITEHGRNQTINEIPLGHIKIIKPEDPGFLPHPSPGANTPPSFSFSLILFMDQKHMSCSSGLRCSYVQELAFLFLFFCSLLKNGIISCHWELFRQMLYSQVFVW